MIEYRVHRHPILLPLRLLRILVAEEGVCRPPKVVEEVCQNQVEVMEVCLFQEVVAGVFRYLPKRAIHRLIGGYYSSRNHHPHHSLLEF